jgi:hypothetical protein
MSQELWFISGLYFIIPALTAVAWFFLSRAAKTPEQKKRALRTLLFVSGLLISTTIGTCFGIGSAMDSDETRRMGGGILLFFGLPALVVGLILAIPRPTRLLGAFLVSALGTLWLSYQFFNAISQHWPWLRF